MSVEFRDKRVNKFLNDLQKKTKDVHNKEFGRALSAIVFKDIDNHFKEEKGPGGVKWKRWSSSYQAAIDGTVAFRKINGRIVPLDPSKSRVKLKPPRKPGKKLQASGRLRQAFLPTNLRLKKQGFEWFNPAKTEDGFPYAVAHDEGGGKLPQRKFMWLSDKAMKVMSKAMLAFVLGKKK